MEYKTARHDALVGARCMRTLYETYTKLVRERGLGQDDINSVWPEANELAVNIYNSRGHVARSLTLDIVSVVSSSTGSGTMDYEGPDLDSNRNLMALEMAKSRLATIAFRVKAVNVAAHVYRESAWAFCSVLEALDSIYTANSLVEADRFSNHVYCAVLIGIVDLPAGILTACKIAAKMYVSGGDFPPLLEWFVGKEGTVLDRAAGARNCYDLLVAFSLARNKVSMLPLSDYDDDFFYVQWDFEGTQEDTTEVRQLLHGLVLGNHEINTLVAGIQERLTENGKRAHAVEVEATWSLTPGLMEELAGRAKRKKNSNYIQ